MLARLTAHSHEIECHDVDLVGTACERGLRRGISERGAFSGRPVSRSEIIRQTKVFTPALLDRLPRKSKPQTLRLEVIFPNDQIVSFRVAWKIPINQLRFKQFFANRLGLDLCKFWVNGFFQDRFVFFLRFPPLFELPLSFEQSRFVDKGKYFCEIGDLNNLRAIKRSFRNMATD